MTAYGFDEDKNKYEVLCSDCLETITATFNATGNTGSVGTIKEFANLAEMKKYQIIGTRYYYSNPSNGYKFGVTNLENVKLEFQASPTGACSLYVKNSTDYDIELTVTLLKVG